MNLRVYPTALLFIIVFLFTNCDSKKTIPEEEFVIIYAELVSRQDQISDTTITLKNIREEILREHNYSEKDYTETIKYFNDSPEKWEDFFNKVIAYLEQPKDSVKKLP